MTRVTSITVGAREVAPGPVQFSSRERSVSVTLELDANDDYDAALAEAKAKVEAALAAARPTAHRPQPSAPSSWQLRVRGAVGERHVLGKLGLRWDKSAFALDAPDRRALDAWLAEHRDAVDGRVVEIIAPT